MAEQPIPTKFTGQQTVDDIVVQFVHLVREASITHGESAVYHATAYLLAKMTHDLEHGTPLPGGLRRSTCLGTAMRTFLQYWEQCNAICDGEQEAAKRRARGAPDFDA